MKMLAVSMVSVLLSMFAASAQGQTQGQDVTWTIDGAERHALVFTPKTRAATAPAVFVFHGAGDTAENFSGVGFQNAWPEAVVVYMQGLGRTPGGGGAFQTTDASAQNRDLKFFDAALASLKVQYRIDPARVYATGFSNGAKFVYLLWATRPQAVTALAPVAGMLTAKVAFPSPKPLFHIGGRQDHQNEFTEQLASIELGKAANRASGKGTPCGADCTLYESQAGASVMALLHPAGHVYPPNATALIVKFFQTHR